MARPKRSAYERITDAICSKLEAGVVPWEKPWNTPHRVARSVATGKPYRGVNALVLACQGWDDPRWLTYKGAQELGGHVRKGEKATPIIAWRKIEPKDDPGKRPGERSTSDDRPRFFARCLSVFNLAQTEGVDPSRLPAVPERPAPRDFDPIQAAERIVGGWSDAPPVRHGGAQAFYRPREDSITMPDRVTFRSEEEYYSTLFHELVHSTGHEKRLKREGITAVVRFGSKAYSREELVAELGAAMLCGEAQIEGVTLDNSAAYCRSWLLKLRADASLLPVAAQQSSKAADLILGRTGGGDDPFGH